MQMSRNGFRSSLGLALRLVRQYRGVSQEDLADTTSRTYLSDVERGRKALTVEKLRYYAVRLQVSTASIVALAETLDAAGGTSETIDQLVNDLALVRTLATGRES